MKFAGLALLLLFAAACTPYVATRGNFVDPDELQAVTIGKSTKEEVRTALGSPTDTGTMNDNTWYYVGQQTERLGFRKEEVTGRRVVVVAFDEAGIVQSVTPLENQGREVGMSERVTPTSGHNLTILQQFFGNLGRFNKDEEQINPAETGPFN